MDPMKIAKKYGVYDCSKEPYLLMISQSRRGYHPVYKYNTILTITSDSIGRSLDITKKFAEKSKIKFREAPEGLSKTMQKGLALSFEVFKKYGERTMEVLRKE